MAASTTWAIELPAINHPASLEIPNSTPAKVALDNDESRQRLTPHCR